MITVIQQSKTPELDAPSARTQRRVLLLDELELIELIKLQRKGWGNSGGGRLTGGPHTDFNLVINGGNYTSGSAALLCCCM